MIEITKTQTQTEDDRINTVMQHFYIEHTVDAPSVSSVLAFYQEMASGVFEGYTSWILEEQKEVVHYLQQLEQHLKAAGASEMAQVVSMHALQVWDATTAFEQQEITEDEYLAVIELGNTDYFKQEENFQKQMALFIEKVFDAYFIVRD